MLANRLQSGAMINLSINSQTIKMKDQIVESLIEKYRQRSEVGIKKYGTTLDQNNKDNYLVHLQQELMDASLYIEKLLKQQNDTRN
jgi:hypothetical protein